MNITIFRRRFTPWGVDGTMVINGVYFTGTVEHPKKFLPAGHYKIAPVPIKFQKKIEVEVKETEEEKEKNKTEGVKNEKKFETEIVGGKNHAYDSAGERPSFEEACASQAFS